jgi:formate dehydrogenase major subunit
MSWRKYLPVLGEWSIPRQLAGEDPYSTAAESAQSRRLRPRLEAADRVGTSICPYCAVGCAQLIYAKGNDVLHVEGDPRSPINQGTLCPKGAATYGWMVNPNRLTKVKYRAPYATEWTELELGRALDMVADRFLEARRKGWQDVDDKGRTVRRTMGIASLGGATLDNEENYLIKKLFTAAGAIQIENQARI